MIPNAKNGTVKVGGTEMYFACFGRGKKTLTVLPGLSDGLATVKGKAMLLAGSYRPIFDDYTVYVFSRKNDMPEGYSVWDMADDQAAALKELGVEKTAVLGVSQGGMIALAMALDHPGLVEKLVLAVSAPRATPLIRERVGRWIELAEDGDHKQLMIDTVENSYSPERLKKLRRAYHLIGSIGKPKDYRRFLINAHSILAFDAFDRLGTVACPTLILAGEDDKIVGVEASREMRQRIPNSTLHVYPGLGHAAYEEAADFYERIFRFLKQN